MKLIPLTQDRFAQVDDEDYEWLNQWKWYAADRHHTWYAVRNVNIDNKKTILYMHSCLCSHTTKQEVDHIDHNGLNNQKSNLRICSHLDNSHNQSKRKVNNSGYKGVVFRDPKWEAYIRVNYNQKYLGTFISPEDAAHAYDEAAKQYYGEFAKLNFNE